MSAINHEEKLRDDSKVKQINRYLNSGKTRILGLELLTSYLPQCSNEELVDCCANWMQSCCKDGFPENNNRAINLLSELFKVAANVPELKKPVSFFIATRYFDYFFKYCSDSWAGWECTKTCLLLFRGACGPFQKILNEQLESQLSKNINLSHTVLHCVSLLPCLGGKGNDGFDYKTNWKHQFMKYLNMCHSIFDKLFSEIKEPEEYDSKKGSFSTKGLGDIKSLVINLRNYCCILSFMLKNKYPATKCIPTDLLFQLICRGLAVSSEIVGKNETTNTIALKKALPDIYLIVFQLLNSLIIVCRSQLLPYSQLVCKLIKQSLESALTNYVFMKQNIFFLFRISIYEALCNWLIATKNGSYCDTISKTIISNAIKDIQIKKVTTHLKESNYNNKKEEIDLHRTYLCYSALVTLQNYIKFYGPVIKQEKQKFLMEAVLKLITDVQNNSFSCGPTLYCASMCRLQLYQLLWELVNQSNDCSHSLLYLSLRIFSRGITDSCLDISQFCYATLNMLTNIIHSQFDNMELFPSNKIQELNISRELLQCKQKIVEIASENSNTERELESDSTCVTKKTLNDDHILSIVGEINDNLSQKFILQESDSSSIQDSINPEIYNKEKFEIEKNCHTDLSITEKKGRNDESPTENEPRKKKQKICVDQTDVDGLKNASKNVNLCQNTLENSNQKISVSPEKSEILFHSNEQMSPDDFDKKRKTSCESLKDGKTSGDSKNKYFLRSKSEKCFSEDKDSVKEINLTDKPLEKILPERISGNFRIAERPKTRAFSKLEKTENFSPMQKKDFDIVGDDDGDDNDEDILQLFSDSVKDTP